MNRSKPRYLLIFKIVGALGVALCIVGVILAVSGFGDFESNDFMIGTFLAVFGMIASFSGIFIGFGPEIAKMRARTVRYIHEENKEDMTAIATSTAEIISEAVQITANAVANGKRESKFCKHCGKSIDADSTFCAYCGKSQ